MAAAYGGGYDKSHGEGEGRYLVIGSDIGPGKFKNSCHEEHEGMRVDRLRNREIQVKQAAYPRLNDISTNISISTGFPSMVAGSNFQRVTVSMAFSSRPAPSGWLITGRLT